VEIVSCCTSKSWRVELVACDVEARLTAEEVLEGATWEAADGGWRRTGEREFATEEDPLLSMTVGAGSDPTVCATLNVRIVRLRPGRSAVPALLRGATARETFETRLRWILGWGHFGCIEPDESAFWAARTEARAFVAPDVKEWLASGVPVPVDGIARGLGIFVVYTGRDVSLGEFERTLKALEAAYPDTPYSGGLYITEAAGARALIAVADLDDGLVGEMRTATASFGLTPPAAIGRGLSCGGCA
jgi:hypothetical protein